MSSSTSSPRSRTRARVNRSEHRTGGSDPVAAFVGILFDGIAYGSLLFLISLGLSVTMGLMNFVNLAHGTFAMMGGFLCVELCGRAGMPFLATLPVVFVAVGLAGAVLERLLYRRLYRRSHLDQVLFTIGLSFTAVGAATWAWGPSQQPVRLPAFLRGQIRLLGIDGGAYRLFPLALGAGGARGWRSRRWDWLRRSRSCTGYTSWGWSWSAARARSRARWWRG